MKKTEESPIIFPTNQINAIHGAYENLSVQVGETWYFMTYEDLTKLLQKSITKLKVVKKRTRTWLEPIK